MGLFLGISRRDYRSINWEDISPGSLFCGCSISGSVDWCRTGRPDGGATQTKRKRLSCYCNATYPGGELGKPSKGFVIARSSLRGFPRIGSQSSFAARCFALLVLLLLILYQTTIQAIKFLHRSGFRLFQKGNYASYMPDINRLGILVICEIVAGHDSHRK